MLLKKQITILSVVLISGLVKQSLAQISTLVTLNNGKLAYKSDIKGNIVPDFSGVGYMNSETPIPNVNIIKTIYPLAGDNLRNIQNAIDEIAGIPLDANGFRGTLLFAKGTYNISDTIKINAGGIVLRGEGEDGNGTNIIATKPSKHTLFDFRGSTPPGNISSSKKAIIDSYVPFGAKKVTVAAGHIFKTGDKVFIHRIPNQAWVKLLKMDSLTNIDPANTTIVNWTPSAYDIYYERKITGINGNSIEFDAPVMDYIDQMYATGEVLKFNSNRIENCGIENMRISSNYSSSTDENHGWEAVSFENVSNGWSRNLEVFYFGYSAVHIASNASFITVDSCKMTDPKSLLDGGRRYSFNVDGQRCLVKNCFTRNGRHDFVNGSQTAGPNVFYNCNSTLQQADIGPHHRWSTGILFDNVVGNGAFAVQNRTNSGTGHGWSGAQTMFWNCEGSSLVLQDPQGDNSNWAIGHKGWITNIGNMTTEPLGIIESQNVKIDAIPSLFQAQLNERLNALLPLEFKDFGAILKQGEVFLWWSIMTEDIIKVFYIEHSMNGKDFYTIGTLKSYLTNSYKFSHTSPKKGMNYYRLRIIDSDGKITYSEIKIVSNSKNPPVLKSAVVKNTIDIMADGSTTILTKLYNIEGRLILSKQIAGNTGINISALHAGMYFLQYGTENITRIIKL